MELYADITHNRNFIFVEAAVVLLCALARIQDIEEPVLSILLC